MYLRHLSLTHFRNYARLEVDLPARVNVLQGDNAQGKTNLLEAVFYLATTRSPLAASDRQLIHWDAEQEVIPYVHAAATFVRGGRDRSLEVTLAKEPQSTDEPAVTTLRRQIRVDGVPRRAIDAVGQLVVVLFLPDDIALVAGAPGMRRRYLDITLCQIDPVYCRTLSRYNRVLAQRNALLRQVRERQAAARELSVWDEQLAALGAYVLARRLWVARCLAERGTVIHPELTGGQEVLTLDYQARLSAERPTDSRDAVLPRMDCARLPETAEVEALEPQLRRGLDAARRDDILRGVTTIGPHRDDVRFLINGIDATIYGSRGQQRTVALGLKLAEVQVMEEHTGEAPVLLLDDVVSELDRDRSRYLLRSVARAQQVLLTTTDLGFLGETFLEGACLWRVERGTVQRMAVPGET
ncbi:MAG TPA: DNA replication/repair protein RecF [Chloroflexi bacterium]|jgi:DNA replication and repair protein RecF|nr:DNA replication/repair protein RecF [Chloroflexota bacterium]